MFFIVNANISYVALVRKWFSLAQIIAPPTGHNGLRRVQERHVHVPEVRSRDVLFLYTTSWTSILMK